MLYRLNSKLKTRCPSCGHARRFSPYVLTETGRPVDTESCGRCDRVNSCGYHQTPRQWMLRHPDKAPAIRKSVRRQQTDWVGRLYQHHFATTATVTPPPTTTTIGDDIVRSTCAASLRRGNTLYRYVCSLFNDIERGREAVDRVFDEYGVGTWDVWGGSPVFWLADEDGHTYDGKVMGYDPVTGKRVKTPAPRINWASSLLTRSDGLQRHVTCRPLFGQHLLKRYPHSTLMVVESEKTALVLAVMTVLNLWDDGLHLALPVATGSLTNLGADREKVFVRHCRGSLRSRILFLPDRGCYGDWLNRMTDMTRRNRNLRIDTGTFMEQPFPAHLGIADGDDPEDVISRTLRRPLFPPTTTTATTTTISILLHRIRFTL